MGAIRCGAVEGIPAAPYPRCGDRRGHPSPTFGHPCVCLQGPEGARGDVRRGAPPSTTSTATASAWTPGAPCFVAADVGKALGLSQPAQSMALQNINIREVQNYRVPGTKGRPNKIITEAGTYDLVFQSRGPEAKPSAIGSPRSAAYHPQRRGLRNIPPQISVTRR
ncbi:Bro-N domain-containing protein [Rhodobacter lacus]|uniref:Bro-N domain-containing protein n=1 Tax=Rhodobacter lacus TaxID=1641972 RepID=A0ABW5A5E5_9RHOB